MEKQLSDVMAKANTIFESGVFSKVDPVFKDIKITAEVKNPKFVEFYELLDDSNLLQAFLGINNKPSTLAMSEKTVTKFCKHNRLFLDEDRKITFFYLGDQIVAGVESRDNGLEINKYDLHSTMVLSANRVTFFIIPA